jgi:hypothetical protein
LYTSDKLTQRLGAGLLILNNTVRTAQNTQNKKKWASSKQQSRPQAAGSCSAAPDQSVVSVMSTIAVAVTLSSLPFVYIISQSQDIYLHVRHWMCSAARTNVVAKVMSTITVVC